MSTTVDIKPKPQTITIPVETQQGKQTRRVKATVYGPLAIHRDITLTENWAITHIPTGRWIYADISIRHARHMVRSLLALPIEWETLTQEGIEAMDPDAKKALGRLIRGALQ